MSIKSKILIPTIPNSPSNPPPSPKLAVPQHPLTPLPPQTHTLSLSHPPEPPLAFSTRAPQLLSHEAPQPLSQMWGTRLSDLGGFESLTHSSDSPLPYSLHHPWRTRWWFELEYVATGKQHMLQWLVPDQAHCV